MKKLIAMFLALLLVATSALAYDELSKGSKGSSVAQLQQALINQGYLNGTADGDFGKLTAAAVSSFQKANGIPETGIADDTTQNAIFHREEERLSNVVLSSGSTGYDVEKLQNRLIEMGYLSGKATGTFDNNTQAALIIFQSRNGLNPTGIADKAMRDILYSEDARSINDEPISTQPASEAADDNEYPMLMNPDEAYIIERLALVSNIAVIAAATEDNDPNGNLYKPGGYTAQVYFSSTLVSPNADKKTPAQVISEGTDGGGSIEVYRTEEEARNREVYLASFDGTAFSSGSHKTLGTCVVRTSSQLTASQQIAFEAEIIDALTTQAADNILPATEATDSPPTPAEKVAEPREIEDPAKIEPTEPMERAFLFTVPIGTGYIAGEDIEAGVYWVVSKSDWGAISIDGANGSWDYLVFWDANDTARLTLSEGDSFDVEDTALDFYTASSFTYDDPENISLSTGNGYIVGRDIPAGTYSGYAKGQFGVTICIYKSLGGNLVDVIALDDGAELGKTVLNDGYALTIQSGTLHLIPFKGFGDTVRPMATVDPAQMPEPAVTPTPIPTQTPEPTSTAALTQTSEPTAIPESIDMSRQEPEMVDADQQWETYTWKHIQIDVPASWRSRESDDGKYMWFYASSTDNRDGMLMLMEEDGGINDDLLTIFMDVVIKEMECSSNQIEELTIDGYPGFLLSCYEENSAHGSSYFVFCGDYILVVTYYNQNHPEMNDSMIALFSDKIHYCG